MFLGQIVIYLLIGTLFSTQCLVCDGDSCGSLPESKCKGNTNCSHILDCCQTDLCNGIVNTLYDAVPPSQFSNFITKQFICGQGGLGKFCTFQSDRCVLNACYQRKEYSSSTCPADTCELGNCPVGKLFPDGSQCCNPKGVNVLDCFGNGEKTWDTCTDPGCSYYGGNCYPDLCSLLPTSVTVVIDIPVEEEWVKDFCYKDTVNDIFRQNQCYSYPPDECYNHDECFFASGQCPFDTFTGQSSSGCCAKTSDQFKDTTECVARNSANCVDSAQKCVWRESLGVCAINPLTASASPDGPACTMKEIVEEDTARVVLPWSILLVLSILLLMFE